MHAFAFPMPEHDPHTVRDGLMTTVYLEHHHAEQLRALAERLYTDPIRNRQTYVRQAHLLSRQLPSWLVRIIYDFETSGGGLLRVRNMPSGPNVPTPTSAVNEQNKDQVIGKLTAIIGAAFGHLVGYRPESSGSVNQALIPVAGHEDLQVSTSSQVTLEFHVEQTFNLFTRPDFIILGANRGAPDAATYVMPNTALLTLPDETLTVLRSKTFYANPDPSFVRGGVEEIARGPMPLLYGAPWDPQSNFDLDSLVIASSEQQRAVDEVVSLWEQHHVEVVLETGDLIVVDQSRLIHGRSAFRRRGDGLDRWIARVQVLKSHSQSRFARKPGSPVIEPHGF